MVCFEKCKVVIDIFKLMTYSINTKLRQFVNINSGLKRLSLYYTRINKIYFKMYSGIVLLFENITCEFVCLKGR